MQLSKPVSSSYRNYLHCSQLDKQLFLNFPLRINCLGGIDFLLHLLTSISQLPVTKLVVKESGLGKKIGTIEKHKICAGTPNESAIVERVSAIKDAWHKSVKVRKDINKPQNKDSTTDDKISSKRELESAPSQSSPPTTKKMKLDDPKKSSSFSSLLKKVAPSSSDKPSADRLSIVANDDASNKTIPSKNKGIRLKWKDHFGGKLTTSNTLEDGETKAGDENESGLSGSAWKDNQKRDRIREKELVAKYKYVTSYTVLL